ncbi:MAG: FecR domain-containing protein [Lautropia sp.]|nr:FecR domain-containing protein [Lautropia sp.]
MLVLGLPAAHTLAQTPGSGAPQTQPFPKQIRLILASGDVRIEHTTGSPQAGAPGQPARSGDWLQPGQLIITGADGRAQIRFSDGGLISLQPGSRFQIDQYRFDQHQQRGFYRLFEGTIRAISGKIGKRHPDDFQLNTPSASIGIRGTEFLVQETRCAPRCAPGQREGLNVAVSSGRVFVFNTAGSIELSAGRATYVASATSQPQPTTIKPVLTAPPTRKEKEAAEKERTEKEKAVHKAKEQEHHHGAEAEQSADGTDGTDDAKDSDGSAGSMEMNGSADDPNDSDNSEEEDTGNADDSSVSDDSGDSNASGSDAESGSGSESGDKGRIDGSGSADTGDDDSPADNARGPGTGTSTGSDGNDTTTDAGNASASNSGSGTGSNTDTGASSSSSSGSGSDSGSGLGGHSDTGPGSDPNTNDTSGRSTGTGSDDHADADDSSGTSPGSGTMTNHGSDIHAGSGLGSDSDSSPGPSTDTGSNTAPDDGTDAGSNSGTNTGSGSSTDIGAGANADAGSAATNAEPGSDTGSGSDPGKGSSTDSGSGVDTGSKAGADAGTGSRQDTGIGAMTGSGSGTGSWSGSGSGSGSGSSDSGSGADPGAAPDTRPGSGDDASFGSESSTASGADSGSWSGANAPVQPELPDPDMAYTPAVPSGPIQNVLQIGTNIGESIRLTLLNTPWPFNHRFEDDAPDVLLDENLGLQQSGDCGLLPSCLSLGTATIAESGSTPHVSWGRWTDGSVRLRHLLISLEESLRDTEGIHYLAGTPTVTMPTEGQARYQLIGATAPTFASGQYRPGSFSGQGLVQFGPGTGTRVAIEGEIRFGNDQHYRMVSDGARFDAQHRLIDIGNSNLHMSTSNTFSGDLSVQSIGSNDEMKCGSGNCRAGIDGAFFGEQASHMGFSYSVHNPAHSADTDTINGVAVMKRE